MSYFRVPAGALRLALGLLLCGGPALAQPPENGGMFHLPSLERSDIQLAAAGAALTLAALAAEDAALTANKLDSNGALDGSFDFGNGWGSSWTMIGLTAGMGALGLVTGRPRLEGAAVDLGKSLLLTGAIVGFTKVAVGRTRPNGGNYSFPSGHTAVAFAAAPVLAHHFGPVVGALAYTSAALTGFGRMEDSKHYLSDVIAGATVGLIVGRMVARDSRISVYGSSRSLGVSYRF